MLKPPLEIELKLGVPAEAIERIGEDDTLHREADGPGDRQTLDATYFDTADRSLSRRGIALRVRREGSRTIQTIKADARNLGGLTARAEWQWPIRRRSPDLGVIDIAEAQAALDDIEESALAPYYATKVQRRLLTVVHRSSRIEVAIDQGAVIAGRRRQPITEVELELVEGREVDLYDLALALADRYPLTLEPRSKAARGAALADGLTPAAAFRKPASLERGMAVDDLIAWIMSDCLAHFTENVAAARDGRDVEGVHQARVALRRLRSAFAQLKDFLRGPAVDQIKSQARTLASALGPARDLDVFATETLPPLRHFTLRPALDALERRAEAARGEAYDTVRQVLGGPEAARFALLLGYWIADRTWRLDVRPARLAAPVEETAAGVLSKRFTKLKRVGRNFEAMSTEQRHAVRIELKKLRYAVDFFGGLFPGKARGRFAKRLKALQDDLGFLQDAAVTGHLLDRLDDGGADPAFAEGRGLVEGWLAHRLATANEGVVADWRALAKATPFWHD
ncbi:MAG: CHAD domain-containing protein [Azospirillaceae bacterium]